MRDLAKNASSWASNARRYLFGRQRSPVPGAIIKRVIFNADDFGLTDGVSSGIADAIANGVVTATTAMVCSPGSRARLEEWGAKLNGKIGLHLQLTSGRPCLDQVSVRSLVDERGEFPSSASQVKAVEPEEIKQEWAAQFGRLKQWGISPTHVDSHHHVGTKPGIVATYVETARLQGVPARATSADIVSLLRRSRVPCADMCITSWYDDDLTPRRLLRTIEAAFRSLQGRGTIEIMCHPGYADPELTARSKYVKQREHELKALTSTKLATGLRRQDIELVSASSLALGPETC